MIIKLKCPRCNAALEVNVSKDFFFCPYCGIRLERAMNKYAKEGRRLHTIITAPTRDVKTQLTTMVFERDIPDE